MIPIYKPYLTGYKEAAHKALDSEWISNYGIYVDLTAKKICDTMGVNYCILMNNGTSATLCLYKALKYKYPNIQKIYVPNNVFIAPINCALMEYKTEQIEVMRIDPHTLNINVSDEYINSLDTNSAVMIVHNLGNIVNVPRLKRLRPDLVFIEDNCEGFLGKYEHKYSGTESLCSSISFYANKTITSGEGGAFLTNDSDIYKYIKNIYSHGMSEKRYIHNTLGYNFRMTNIQAGLLYEQLNDLEHIMNLKRNIFTLYDKFFNIMNANNKIIKLQTDTDTVISYWMYCIVIPSIKYNEFEKYMNDKQIQIRPFFYDIREHAHLSDINITEQPCQVIEHGVMLPSYPKLSSEQIEYIVLCVMNYLCN